MLDYGELLELIGQSSEAIKETKRLKKLYEQGLLPASSITPEEHERMLREFYARGGRVIKLPPSDLARNFYEGARHRKNAWWQIHILKTRISILEEQGIEDETIDESFDL